MAEEHAHDAERAVIEERARKRASLESYWELLQEARMLFAGDDAGRVVETGVRGIPDSSLPDFSALAYRLTPQPTQPTRSPVEASAEGPTQRGSDRGKKSIGVRSGREQSDTASPGTGQGGAPDPNVPQRAMDQGLVRIARSRNLGELADLIDQCRRCGLCEGRKRAVPGKGVINPLVMVVGEAPGAEEDSSGEPFVGPAGKYLDSWLAAIQLYRGGNVFMGNVVKCRPPGNRDPLPEEREACMPYLLRQIEIVRPKAILSVGRISSQILTGVSEGIGRIRSQSRGYTFQGIPLVPTYHPSAVLRTPQEYRRLVWDDLQRLRTIITERT